MYVYTVLRDVGVRYSRDYHAILTHLTTVGKFSADSEVASHSCIDRNFIEVCRPADFSIYVDICVKEAFVFPIFVDRQFCCNLSFSSLAILT